MFDPDQDLMMEMHNVNHYLELASKNMTLNYFKVSE